MVSMWVGDGHDDESEQPVLPVALPVPFAMGVTVFVSVAFTLVLGIFPGWLIEAADQVTNYAR
jgi:NADH:ubiquinone oxidoreductase subunit 2 (subunit N)